MKPDIFQAIEDIQIVIKRTDWHQPLNDPSLTLLMIEDKAKLMEAEKKLNKVVEISCKEK